MYIHEEKYLTVSDDWYPCYKGNKISLRVSLCYNDSDEALSGKQKRSANVQIIASGMDDFYLELYSWFDDATLEEANEKYKEFKKIYHNIPDDIVLNKEFFKSIGFTEGI